MLNCAAVMGRLTADPQLKKTESGLSVCSFTVACERDFVKKGEDRQADFIDVVAWRQAAEFVCKYFHKGSMIAVSGSVQTRNWKDKNDSSRKETEIIASTVSFCGKENAKENAAPNVEIPNEGTYQEIPDYDDVPDEGDLPF